MKIDVLDKGYIEVVDTLGDDLTPVNAARVSFGGRSDTFTEKDKRLSNEYAVTYDQVKEAYPDINWGGRS